MSFSHKFERNDFIVSLWNRYHMLKLEILLHLSKKKKKITTTPQLKEQLSKRNLSFFFPLTMRPANSYGLGKAKIVETGKAWILGPCSVVFGSWTKCKICTYCKTRPNYFFVVVFWVGDFNFQRLRGQTFLAPIVKLSI